MTTTIPPIGAIVRYAGARYRVVAVHADLLTLDGVADNVTVSALDGDGSGTARPRCVVLAGDVTVCAFERPQEPILATETPEATPNTGGYS